MKAVIFDFNGTLFLDNDKHVKAWSVISQKLRGKPISEEELHTRCNGLCNAQILEYLAGHPLDPAFSEQLSEEKEALYRQFCKEDTARFHLVEGSEALFDKLKSLGIPFTIASASIKNNIDFFVDSFHLEQWIDPDSIIYDDGLHADKQTMFLDAAAKLGAPVEECTILEDSISGIRCALAVGCKDVRILDQAAPAFESTPGITAVFHTMNDIKVNNDAGTPGIQEENHVH